MHEHKTKLIQNYQERNIDGLIEVLLSLRVNALQIAPELRKNLVYELIRNDIFTIEASERFDFVVGILEINNSSLKHAITSLISVVSSTLRGVEYLTFNNNMKLVEKIIRVFPSLNQIMKEQENGSVTQRFCLAILQKCSIREALIPTLVDHDLIKWTINLLKKSLHQKIHVFCLDFSSAMLANIIHTPSTISFLEHHAEFTLDVSFSSNLAYGKLPHTYSRKYSSFSFDAHINLPFIPF